jgi:hypothetical protein
VGKENEGEGARIEEGLGYLGTRLGAGLGLAAGRARLRAGPTTLYSLSPASNGD